MALFSERFGRKQKSMWPDDGGLKEPVWTYDETFSAVEVLKEMFFTKVNRSVAQE